MLKQLVLITALGTAAILSGCESMPSSSATTAQNLQLLQNRTWIATQIGNTEIKTSPSDRNIPSIQLDEATKRVSGADGCNRIMGSYNATADQLSFGPLAGSQMACLNNGNIDQKYNEALRKVTHYQVFGKTLKLLDRNGNLLIQYQSAVQPR